MRQRTDIHSNRTIELIKLQTADHVCRMYSCIHGMSITSFR